jgi:hypothetical protein
MRLWSLHPRYLDPAGLVAVWREGLLARAVLRGATRGYRHHPQLERFRASGRPVACVDTYLAAVWEEAMRRGYRFDRRKLGRGRVRRRVPVSAGQVAFEWAHLLAKVRRRRPDLHRALVAVAAPRVHPLFRVVPGPVAEWERRGGAVHRRVRGDVREASDRATPRVAPRTR